MKTLGPLGNALIAIACLTAVSRDLAAANNIILFIGDGMGPAHVKAGRAYVTGSTATPLELEGLGYAGQALTTLPGGVVTDSATAGTALATGYQHPVNGTISMGANNAIKTTILELARGKNYRTGIITTDDIGGATPGAFGAHEPDRSLTADIRYDYFFDDVTYGHTASLPNVLLGGGYDDKVIVPGLSVSLVTGAKSLGYQFVTTGAELSPLVGGKVLGLFGSGWNPLTGMAYRSASSQPTLSEMVTKALALLNNDGGVFLMVEGANIDKFSHSNDRNFVAEVAELNRAVQVAIDWAAHVQAVSGPTLLLVTADHETGGVSVPDNQIIAPGTMPIIAFTSTGHTAANVPVFANWPASLQDAIIDNTETFFLMEDYLNLPEGKPPVVSGISQSGLTETGVMIQWTTAEPSDSHVEVSGQVFGTANRVTAHSVACSGLAPGTAYTGTVKSKDLAGFEGTGSASFTTKAGNGDALVVGEPIVTLGSVSGSYLGALAASDGSKQTITEVPSGQGSRLTVEYLLRSTTPRAQIGSVTIEGNVTWSQSDGTSDNLMTSVWSFSSQKWQAIRLPFTLYAGSDCIDESGGIRIEFRDSASFRREKKDTLTIDYLVGVVGRQNQTALLDVAGLSETASSDSVQLSWYNLDGEDGYQVFRREQVAGQVVDKLVASVPADTTSFEETGLTPATTYTYLVQACNSAGCSAKMPINSTTQLAAPGNLTAASVKGAVNLSWSNSNPGSVSFKIYRDDVANGDFPSIADTPVGTLSYSDTSAPKGVTSYYRVQAVLNGQHGPLSNPVSGRPR